MSIGLTTERRLSSRSSHLELAQPMNDDHVVFGTGRVGHPLIGQLAGSGHDVPAVLSHRPTELPEGVDWRGADVTDPEAAADAADRSTSVGAGSAAFERGRRPFR